MINRSLTKAKEYPVKVLQFGEGNFLRGFVDYMVDVANEKGVFNGSVVIVKPITYGNLEQFHKQECQYTLLLRGKRGQEAVEDVRQITCVKDAVDCYTEYVKYMDFAKCDTLRFIVSNTTEAGIVYDATDDFNAMPPMTYPGKLTKFLFERFNYFKGDKSKGLIIIPCELIEHNGQTLKQCIKQFIELWKLGDEFSAWIDEACSFCSTLVDRIVTGYPGSEIDEICKKIGYEDKLVDTGELFALWVIECEDTIEEELPLPKAGLPVIFTTNQAPYRERKVRILNGAHTSFVLASYLAGNDYVKESMEDSLIRNYMMKTIFDEIIPTLSLPKEECIEFANAVIERFENPFIKHALLSISLNSVSKWKTRCMPSFEGYINLHKQLPVHLTFSLAALLAFYRSDRFDDGALTAVRGENEYKVKDGDDVLAVFKDAANLDTAAYVQTILSNTKFWGKDLTCYEGLAETITKHLNDIKEFGIRATMEKLN